MFVYSLRGILIINCSFYINYAYVDSLACICEILHRVLTPYFWNGSSHAANQNGRPRPSYQITVNARIKCQHIRTQILHDCWTSKCGFNIWISKCMASTTQGLACTTCTPQQKGPGLRDKCWSHEMDFKLRV